MTFKNLLTQNDRVLHVPSKRQGKVTTTPRESSRRAAILFDGSGVSAKYIDVMDLRLLVNNVPEEVPPIEGTPPEEVAEPTVAVRGSALDVVTRERDANVAEMETMTLRFRVLKTANERLDRAIIVLKGGE